MEASLAIANRAAILGWQPKVVQQQQNNPSGFDRRPDFTGVSVASSRGFTLPGHFASFRADFSHTIKVPTG